MLTIQQAFELALQHHQSGRPAEAEALYRQILAAQPDHADALHHLGLIAYQVGRHELAVELISRAIALHPNNPGACSNLGEAYRAMGARGEAIAHFRRALELDPAHAAAHYNLGNTLRELARLDEAITAYRRAVESRPDYAEAHNNLGIALAAQDQHDAAIAAYRRALELKPGDADLHNNLGTALAARGRLDEAIAAYRRALELNPEHVQAWSVLGVALAEQGRLDEAIAAHRRAIELKPGYAEAHNNFGLALAARGQLDEAIRAYRRALELKPDYFEAHNNLSIVLRESGQLDEAIAACRRVLQLKPDHSDGWNNLGIALKDRGALDEALAAFRRALELQPGHAAALANLIYALHFQPGENARVIAAEQERWNRQFGDPVKRFILPQANDRSPERRLRIGYVSPDFYDHVVGRNLLPLLQRHNRHEFEIVCYSATARRDNLTDRFRQYADRWRETLGVTDEALAGMIRQDAVDILVDLSQHMAGNRLPVFAHRPAPVQVSFAGYPESTGVEAIEYRISDRYLEPEMESCPGRERVFLIDSFWCYDPCGMEVAVNKLPAKESGHVTFGSLNNFCKINDPVLKLWARVLRAAPDARLMILTGLGSHRERTWGFLEGEGVAPTRVEFVEPRPRKAYLELYHRLDVVLDPFPYGGHTTSLDALWMGVPVVSLAGERAASRAGLSQLSNLGLPELVAHAEDEYVQIATQLTRDLPRLDELRRTLRARMETSVLMDAPRFAHNIEAACRAMWRRWCAEQTDAR